MGRMRVVGSIVVAVIVVGGAAGCSGDDSGGGRKPSASASEAKPVAPRDALAAYEQETASGCTDADDCQQFMTRKLAAAVKVRKAMEAKDRQTYAEPIGDVAEAERQADHFGRDNLGAKGNSLAVSLPLQRMVAWFREHPEG
ncbi:hypothetical protein ACFC96_12520 [Streptomyces sp. NPDC055955]|uniref:hypothetical protein n=1 Tax=Streptomyces sp. NPDC055955 TaxID=3345665 RepID=UPI0035E239F4